MAWKRRCAGALALVLTLGLLLALAPTVRADEAPPEAQAALAPAVETVAPGGSAKSVVPETTAKALLLMDCATGTVLAQENPHEVREPASVTKIMTMLLVCEALDAGTLTMDTVVTASAHAAGMGGSQVYLEEGEQMTVHDLLKAVAVASGNDAAVALGEAVSGSESAFVEKMNQRAKDLQMADTHFCNCTGLPAEGHVTSAWDIAIMSRELLRHDVIREFTGIWMDSLRDGAFGLTSTNRLVRTYDGATGLKTGFTDRAGFCVSASAARDGMELIAVVLGAESSKDRFDTAATLLDYGFANFTLMTVTPDAPVAPIPVRRGTADTVAVETPQVQLLVPAADRDSVTWELQPEPFAEAPVEPGDVLGSFTVSVAGSPAATVPLTAAQRVEKRTLALAFGDLFRCLLGG